MNLKDIPPLLDRWLMAVQSGNPDLVVALYAEDAILLPTVSDRIRHNHDEIRDYFVHFLANHPVGEIDEANPRTFGKVAVNSGIYTFTFPDAPPVQARFSFVYRPIGGRWLIVDHHSSRMPEQAAPADAGPAPADLDAAIRESTRRLAEQASAAIEKTTSVNADATVRRSIRHLADRASAAIEKATPDRIDPLVRRSTRQMADKATAAIEKKMAINADTNIRQSARQLADKTAAAALERARQRLARLKFPK